MMVPTQSSVGSSGLCSVSERCLGRSSVVGLQRLVDVRLVFIIDEGERRLRRPRCFVWLGLRGQSLVTITGFPDPALFATFGLPECL
jgi:hypothetical protein